MWIVQSRLLAALPNVSHGFFGCTGGVSSGDYTSLNVGLGSADAPECVAQNRQRVMRALGASRGLVSLRQVHGSTVLPVSQALPDDARPEADGIFTSTVGLAVGVLTADCVPVLLAEPHAGVVTAVHAGWKGVHANIIAEAVARIEASGGKRERIIAAIGPCIAQISYEVGAELCATFLAQDSAFAAFFTSNPTGRFQFDVGGAAALCLQREGIGAWERLACDTYANPARFFSYRRTTHHARDAGLPVGDYGRQISAISLR
jgi:polyphenol oxidase